MNKHRTFPQLVVVLALFVAAPRAQDDSLCSFNWYSNESCNTYTRCLGGQWNGQTKTVPVNVTRIDEDGLTLCLENPAVVADVVYLMDLSASMLASFTFGAGDPDGKRPEALQVAFEYQKDNMPQSRAGYAGFAGDVVTQGWQGTKSDGTPFLDAAKNNHVLEPVVVNDNWSKLQQMVSNLQTHINDNERLEGTNYNAALGKAIEWFKDNNKTPHDNQAVVFLSDGNPSRAELYHTQSQIDYLTANDIPVYGIFLWANLDQADDTTNALDTLVQNTDGKYYVLESDSTHKLSAVLENIVKEILTEYELSSVSVQSGGVTGTADSMWQDTSGVWAATIDKFLPVSGSKNQVSVSADFTSARGDTNLNFTFTLDPSGPAQPGSPCYVCRPRSTVEVSPTELSAKKSTFTVTLSYFGDDTLSSVDIRLNTSTKGDQETITVSDYTTSGEAQIFETSVAFAVTDNAASKNDNTVQADSTDKMRVYWQHPVDTRDTAQKIVSVETPYGPYVVKALYYLGDPLGQNPSAKDTLEVIFHEALDCADLGSQDPTSSFNYFPTEKSETDIFKNAKFVTDCPADGHDSVVTIVFDHTDLIAPGNDSLQARENKFFDRQDNPTELRPAGPVVWGRNYGWVMRGSPNPFWPGNEDHAVPKRILDRVNLKAEGAPSEQPPEIATVVELTSIKGVDLGASGVEIYDALGNLVRDDLPVYPRTDNKNKFYIFWDGYNRYNRRCGTGTYLAIISVREKNEGTTDIKRHKIAIVNGKTQ